MRQLVSHEKRAGQEDWTPFELPNGMVIRHLNGNETEFCYHEIFEDRCYLRHGITLPEGACVLDVGANIGLFALFVARSVAGATVYAFEPVPKIFEVLETNCRLYDANIRPFRYGLSVRSGTAAFTYYPHVSIISGCYADPEQERAVVTGYLEKAHSVDSTRPRLPDAVVADLLAHRLRGEHVTCEVKTLSDVIREQAIERIDIA